ncbi:MAG: restriction endonuclease subunit S [Magnetococcales bacterium]|nr:restriction endonuclease subunit S [Magnetococcales bacterium]
MKMVPLAEVCRIDMGQAPQGTSYSQDEGMPLIAGAGDFGELSPKPTKLTTAPSKISQCGDIILCIRATIGDRNWSDKVYCLGRGVAGLRPRDSLNINYLWHYLDAAKEDLVARGRGATFLQVTKNDLSTLPIPLPPLPEQKRIAAILDKADAIRRKRRQALALADQFLRAVFLEMFGDPVTNPKGWPIGTIRDLLSDVRYGTSKKADTSQGAFPVLRMGNITYEGGWNLSDLKYVDLDEREQLNHLAIRDDILFNRTNSKELVGKTAVYDLDKSMAFAGYLIRARVNENADPYYIAAYLNSDHGKATLMGMCKNIIGMANINAQEMQDICIAHPPINLQRDYRRVVDAVKKGKGLRLDGVQEAEHLFGSLTQRAFRGEL